MPVRPPPYDRLRALLERYLTSKSGADHPLPGGQITREELDFAEKDSPVKGQRLRPGLIPDDTAAAASPPPPPPPTPPPPTPTSPPSPPSPPPVRRRRRRLLKRPRVLSPPASP